MDNSDKLKNSIIKSIKFTSGMFIAPSGLVLVLNASPFGIVAGSILFAKGLKLAYNGYTGNNIHNSFLISRNFKLKVDNKYMNVKKLEQSFTIDDFITSRLSEDKQEYFLMRSLNAFQQLEPNRVYITKSQANTVNILRLMQKNGFIKNLKYTKRKKDTHLTVERFLLGVNQRKKKITMFDISFETTNKKMQKHDIEEIIKKYKINIDKYVSKEDNRGNILFYLRINYDAFKKYFDKKFKLVSTQSFKFVEYLDNKKSKGSR